jgi:hypothetical protein
MLSYENANQIFSHLNVLVEELDDHGLTKMKDINIILRIRAVPKEKYANIITYFHQVDLEKYKISQIMGKISGYEMYMGFLFQEEWYCMKDNKRKKMIMKKKSSDDEDYDGEDDTMLFLWEELPRCSRSLTRKESSLTTRSSLQVEGRSPSNIWHAKIM